MKTALVIGSSSWLGHYLIPSINKYLSEYNIVGTSYCNLPLHQIDNVRISNKQIDEFDKLLVRVAPKIIFYPSRSEDSYDFEFHKYLIDYCNRTNTFYAYFSSYNAVDSDSNVNHTEDEAPNAKSDYGKYKAKSENELQNKGQSFCIYRFSATHGWAPNRISRTESFLRKLQNDEEIVINTGVLQNRTATSHLTDMMVAVAKERGQGVFNLGATDASCEYSFLSELANAFGYATAKLKKGINTKCNAHLIPSKITSIFGDQFDKTEKEMINIVSKMAELQKYKRGNK